MSVATIDYTIDETSVERHDDAEDITAWPHYAASLRRQFTGLYVPRHRAEGRAV
jgi:hypothetical protein